MNDWHKLFDGLQGDAVALLKGELQLFVANTLVESDELAKSIGNDMQRYLNQLAKSEITKAQFVSYMRDHERLARMRARKASVESKAALQRVADGIKRLILEGLAKLI